MVLTAASRESGSNHKWVVLSNTTLGVLMSAINQSILIISLPAVFDGLGVNPLSTHQSGLLLWVLLSYTVTTTVFLVLFGKLADMFGRVRLYNFGFLIFTIGSILASITWSKGLYGEIELICFRVVQGIGGGFLTSNSTAILTDAFPKNRRGFALGLNQVSSIGGRIIGLLVGGGLAATGHWRLIFLVNVPIGLAGTVWAYVALREVSRRKSQRSLDYWGNLSLIVGLLGVLLGLTYGINPYLDHSMGWSSPWVQLELISGVGFLVLFVIIELSTKHPLFNLKLFKIWAFTAGNLTGFLSALSRGGLQFVMVIWLQGIYLPLHGVSYADTPLIAGLYTLPQMIAFLIAGPISGALSDRFGARTFSTLGMLITAVGFYLMTTLPMSFNHWSFWTYLFVIAFGMGLFSSPNTTAIMNALPSEYRGVGSGMRSTFKNAGQMLSLGVYFTIMISGISEKLPQALQAGLIAHGIPAVGARQISHLSPTSSLFAALLGYNPLQNLLQQFGILKHMSASQVAYVTGSTFFPSLIGPPFMQGLKLAFTVSFVMSMFAAVISILRGKQYFHKESEDIQ